MNSYINSEVKTLFIVLITILSLFATIFVVWSLMKSDYHGVLTDLEGSIFTLEPLNVDHESEFSVQEIHFNENTKVKGEGNSIDDLKEGQEVKLWVDEDRHNKVANVIKIIE
ncbi:hypothetical protein [Pontibacillus marinus]|uniref:DUF5666 domain-containing protein n=1 Tax=Pontibacillus marinus BH030004 = DSM 16465 TaxID=1385511 RepID=A0A0A5FZN4_9BACI|nr:hypothetical protein [Pontibacillus marinus]KGX86296.1 hypothetical protein N783_12420 [Pontibacillus marinus BH030004 = DSM 16465]